jgi:hypothetical protein
MQSENQAVAVGAPAARDREPRRKVGLTGFGLLEDGSTFAISLIDLSYDGCKIETAVALLPGLHLTVSVLRLGALEATVRWYANGKAGLCFRPEPVDAKVEQPREYERMPLRAKMSLRRSGRQPYSANVFDLSRVGCKVEFIERPKVGEELWAKFDGLESLEATVRWVDGFYGGIQFSRAIYPAVFEILLARLKS